ncbi:UNVERIFIED_CONTAM: hypothetical protein Slati_2290400 [Sesamum latifolium]|uniref:Uncharacterized protein n=1 Tax=Sesamum latifolium TaxID=2727402 RepID=A0AAW2W9N8_9LAMI
MLPATSELVQKKGTKLLKLPITAGGNWLNHYCAVRAKVVMKTRHLIPSVYRCSNSQIKTGASVDRWCHRTPLWLGFDSSQGSYEIWGQLPRWGVWGDCGPRSDSSQVYRPRRSCRCCPGKGSQGRAWDNLQGLGSGDGYLPSLLLVWYVGRSFHNSLTSLSSVFPQTTPIDAFENARVRWTDPNFLDRGIIQIQQREPAKIC